MNLKSLSNVELLNGVRSLRANERKLDRQIVEYISEIEWRRLYAELGFANVIDWLVKDLGYSESSAYRRVMAARAIRAVPEAADKIEDGRLNLVTLAKVQSVIRSEEKRTGERVSLDHNCTDREQNFARNSSHCRRAFSRSDADLGLADLFDADFFDRRTARTARASA